MATWFVTGGSGFVGRNLIRTLVKSRHLVKALVRNAAARRTVEDLGAVAVSGDLDNVGEMTTAMRGCECAVHAAAEVSEWGPRERYEHVNVQGTANVIAAASAAKVRRLVHVGTEAPYATGEPIENIDEREPFPKKMLPRYPATKAAAERLVRAASDPWLETVVVRPRLIWGNDDTSLLPQLVEAVQEGRFMWIGGGDQLTSTCHVDNVCEGILLAAERGHPGEAYFLTDGPPVSAKAFLSELLATQGVTIPDKSVARGLAWTLARTGEFVWDALKLKGPPPVTRIAVALIGVEVTVNDAKARRELGYQGKTSRAAGLKAMSGKPPENIQG